MQTSNEFIEEMLAVKNVVIASEKDGIPSIRVISVIGAHDGALYFVTPCGKDFCDQIEHNPNIAVLAQTPSRFVRLNGRAEKLPAGWVDRLLERQPRLAAMYSGGKRRLLQAFCLRDGHGDCMDRSTPQGFRTEFAVGSADIPGYGFEIGEECDGCGACLDMCPSDAIAAGEKCSIRREACISCGGCLSACTRGAVRRAGGGS